VPAGAIFALVLERAVLACTAAATFSALAPNLLVLTDLRSATICTLAADSAVLTDAGAAALFAEVLSKGVKSAKVARHR
jgi:hypothetical protein